MYHISYTPQQKDSEVVLTVAKTRTPPPHLLARSGSERAMLRLHIALFWRKSSAQSHAYAGAKLAPPQFRRCT